MENHKYFMHYYITGKVQGVCYRAESQIQANKLGISGWVKNSPGGGVEVYALGDQNQQKLFLEWLYQGPPAARVDFIEQTPVPLDQFSIL